MAEIALNRITRIEDFVVCALSYLLVVQKDYVEGGHSTWTKPR